MFCNNCPLTKGVVHLYAHKSMKTYVASGVATKLWRRQQTMTVYLQRFSDDVCHDLIHLSAWSLGTLASLLCVGENSSIDHHPSYPNLDGLRPTIASWFAIQEGIYLTFDCQGALSAVGSCECFAVYASTQCFRKLHGRCPKRFNMRMMLLHLLRLGNFSVEVHG